MVADKQSGQISVSRTAGLAVSYAVCGDGGSQTRSLGMSSLEVQKQQVLRRQYCGAFLFCFVFFSLLKEGQWQRPCWVLSTEEFGVLKSLFRSEVN